MSGTATMPPPTAGAAPAAAEFLATLFADAPGLLAIWSPRQAATFYRNDPGGRRAAAERAMSMSRAGHNVYFGPGLLAERPAPGKRGTANQVGAIGCLWADVDFGPGHKHNVPPDEATARRLLAEAVPPPSIVVHSGGGLHVYWLLSEPWTLADADDRERARLAGVAMQDRIAEVFGREGYHLDPTADLARVLRVPGTANHKLPYPRPVRIIEPAGGLADARRYRLDELPIAPAPATPPAPLTPPRGRARPAPAGGHTAYGEAALAAEVEAVAQAPEGERNNQLNRGSFAIGQLVAGGEIDRGEAERSLLGAAHVAGLPDAEARATVRSGLDAGGREPRTAPTPGGRGNASTAAGAAPAENAAAGRRLRTDLLAEAVLQDHHFARDAGDRLYVFRGGRYTPDGEGLVRREVKRLAIEWGLSGKWTRRSGEETIGFISADAPRLWERPPLDVLNVRNGLLDVNARELRPHDPAFLSPVQLPPRYDLAATCPVWERFVGQVFPEDALELAWQIPAWLMLPDTSIQRAVLLVGEGANGKSTYLGAVVAFIGRGNVCAIPLHRLESDRFAVARLIGRLANVCPDLPSEDLASTSTFKAILGGDLMSAERKYRQDTFEIAPFARLMFSANHHPRSRDGSEAFFRRWCIIPFDRTFEPSEQVPRRELDAMLQAPGELSGVLNRALDVLPRLLRDARLSDADSIREAGAEFRSATDPVAVWLDRATIEGPTLYVPKDELRRLYHRDADRGGLPSITSKAFSQAVKRLRPAAMDSQRMVGGARRWCWQGLGLGTNPVTQDA